MKYNNNVSIIMMVIITVITIKIRTNNKNLVLLAYLGVENNLN